MPRRPRVGCGGIVYHVLNRAVGRAELFHKMTDYEAFERVLAQARAPNAEKGTRREGTLRRGPEGDSH